MQQEVNGQATQRRRPPGRGSVSIEESKMTNTTTPSVDGNPDGSSGSRLSRLLEAIDQVSMAADCQSWREVAAIARTGWRSAPRKRCRTVRRRPIRDARAFIEELGFSCDPGTDAAAVACVLDACASMLRQEVTA